MSQEKPFPRIRLELSTAFAGVALGSSVLWVGAINLHRNADEMQGYLYSKPILREAFESDFLALRVTT